MSYKKAVFLDRDGVIVDDIGHITRQDQVKLIRGSAKAIASLNRKYPVIIVTNQAAVGRGLCSEEDAHKVHNYIISLLEKQGAKIDATYMCFHHPVHGVGKYKVDCDCRKPKPGLLLKAAKEHNIDLANSFFIGDKATDIKAGKLAGTKTILVQTGYGGNDCQIDDVKPDFVAKDLYEAAKIILEETR